jgi:hypothetical protein
MGCVTSSKFVVLINGSASNSFSVQGCPLFPYLFILVAESLSRIMKEAIGSGHLRGVLVGRSMAISHLLFVDDVLIFCFGEEEELKQTLNSLDLFCVGTGIETNFQKSTIFTLNVEGGLHKLATFCTFCLNNVNDGLRYLGYTLKPNCYMKQDWQ